MGSGGEVGTAWHPTSWEPGQRGELAGKAGRRNGQLSQMAGHAATMSQLAAPPFLSGMSGVGVTSPQNLQEGFMEPWAPSLTALDTLASQSSVQDTLQCGTF